VVWWGYMTRPATTETAASIGERELIRRLARLLPASDDMATGIGDDCAVLRVEGGSEDWVATTDPVIADVHFTADAPPRSIGRKAVGRVLSDIAAMGARPRWLFIDLVAPPDCPVAFLEDVYRGAEALAGRHGARIAGGDTATGSVLELHVFGIGSVPAGTAVLRSGAKPGQALCVTGRLGGSLEGGRHLEIEPRIAEGIWLRERGFASALCDISDGLLTDCRHLLECSGAGADLDLDAIPISEAAASASDERTPLDHALSDGEDFELLFAVPEERLDALSAAWPEAFPALPCTRIGTFTATPDVLRGRRAGEPFLPLDGDGYQHFVSAR
jgi:thiamine-monophosphate kinase